MAKWSKKLGLALLNVGLLTMTPNLASANDCGACDPCDPCVDPCSDSCFGGFEISVDFLYWKTCIDDLTYAATISPLDPADSTLGFASRDVEYHNLCPKWKPGFRITLGKDDVWCGMRLEASYTWLNAKAHHRFSEICGTTLPTGSYIESPLIHPLLVGTIGGPDFGFVRASWEGTYHQWDVLLSFELCSSRCYSFNPFFGVAGLVFDQDLDIILSPTCDETLGGSLQMDWENDYFGVGLKAGSLYTYQICDGLSLFAKGSVALYTGNSNNKYNRNRQEAYAPVTGLLTDRLDFYDDDCCQFVPGWHLQVGFNYTSEFCGCESNLHIGWEFLAYENIANPRRFTGNPSTSATPVADLTAADIVSYSTQSNTTTLGFQGLFVGFDFDF